MRNPRGSPRATAAVALAVFLVGVAWATRPGTVAAKPFLPEEDPPYEQGDPTADDQPSPSPKQARRAAAMSTTRYGGSDVTRVDAPGGQRNRLLWLTVARAFIWIR